MNRRAVLAGLTATIAAAPLSLTAGAGRAFAQGGQRFSRIVVDMQPLIARGGSGAAAIIRPQLQASLQREFSGRIGRGGPALTVRVHTVLLSGSVVPGGRRGGGTSSDYLEAEVIAGTQRFPLLVTQDALSAGGAWYLPDNEPRRLRALADSLAAWVARRV